MKLATKGISLARSAPGYKSPSPSPAVVVDEEDDEEEDTDILPTQDDDDDERRHADRGVFAGRDADGRRVEAHPRGRRRGLGSNRTPEPG